MHLAAASRRYEDLIWATHTVTIQTSGRESERFLELPPMEANVPPTAGTAALCAIVSNQRACKLWKADGK